MLKVSMGNKAVIHHAPTEPNVKGIDGQTGRDESRPYGADVKGVGGEQGRDESRPYETK